MVVTSFLGLNINVNTVTLRIKALTHRFGEVNVQFIPVVTQFYVDPHIISQHFVLRSIV